MSNELAIPTLGDTLATVAGFTLPATTVSLTPLTDAAGFRITTWRLTSRSKKPRNADRCRLRLAAEPPGATRYCPTIPGVMAGSSTPFSSAQARKHFTARR
jgi:hypothetical protein